MMGLSEMEEKRERKIQERRREEDGLWWLVRMGEGKKIGFGGRVKCRRRSNLFN